MKDLRYWPKELNLYEYLPLLKLLYFLSPMILFRVVNTYFLSLYVIFTYHRKYVSHTQKAILLIVLWRSWIPLWFETLMCKCKGLYSTSTRWNGLPRLKILPFLFYIAMKKWTTISTIYIKYLYPFQIFKPRFYSINMCSWSISRYVSNICVLNVILLTFHDCHQYASCNKAFICNNNVQ